LYGASYQAANQSSCHNGADVAAVVVATAAVAAFDTIVEFSSGLLQTVLVYLVVHAG